MQLSVKTIVLRVVWKWRKLQRRLSFSGKKFIFLCLLTKEERGCIKVSLLRIQIKNQYKKTLSNPDNTNLLYSNSTNRKETPICASTTASMTIEAAIALPLLVCNLYTIGNLSFPGIGITAGCGICLAICRQKKCHSCTYDT